MEHDGSRDFRAWAFGAARIEALQGLREMARDRHVFDEALVQQIAQEADTLASHRGRQREALELCLERLQQDARMLVL